MADMKIDAAQAHELAKKQDEANRQQRLDTAKEAAERADGWINVLSGVGDTFRDKRLQSYFQRDAVNWQTAEDLWRSSDTAARVVECLPDEMTREGFEIRIQDEVEGEENASQNPAGKPAKPAAGRGDDASLLNIQGAQGPDSASKPGGAAGGRPNSTPLPDDSNTEGDVDSDTALPGSDDSKRIAELLMAKCDDLDVLNKVRMGLYFSRAYGGGALLIGANDGQTDWSKPLDLDNIKSVDFLNVLEPRELLPLFYYGDPRAPKYGEPMIYQLNRIMIAGEIPPDQAYLRVHESRLVRFDGIRVGRRQIVANAGWGDSIFTRVLQVCQDFDNVWQYASLILSDFSQAVLKIKGLAEMVAKNGKQAVLNRAQAVSASRSICGTMLIDADEEYVRTPTPMSGFPEMLDRFCNRLAMAVKTPVTILMGQAPAGLNSTGQSDLEWFSNQVRAEQKRHLLKPLEYLLKVLFRSKDGPTRGEEPENWSVHFPALKQLSDVERADIRLKTSQADASDVQNDILLPAEVAKSRYGGDGYSTETQVDLELREKTRQAVQEDPKDGEGGPPIDHEFHTGAGEPGSEPKPNEQVEEAGVVSAGANKKPGGSK